MLTKAEKTSALGQEEVQQVLRKGSGIEGLGYKKKGKGNRMKTQGNQAAGYVCFIPMTPHRHLQ